MEPFASTFPQQWWQKCGLQSVLPNPRHNYDSYLLVWEVQSQVELASSFQNEVLVRLASEHDREPVTIHDPTSLNSSSFKVCYAMLCYMVICKAPLTGGYSEVLSAWQAGENKSSNYGETQMISPVTSHSEVQEESHSRVQGPPQQRTDSGIEKYGTMV